MVLKQKRLELYANKQAKQDKNEEGVNVRTQSDEGPAD
jgi:hypothetical protein